MKKIMVFAIALLMPLFAQSMQRLKKLAKINYFKIQQQQKFHDTKAGVELIEKFREKNIYQGETEEKIWEYFFCKMNPDRLKYLHLLVRFTQEGDVKGVRFITDEDMKKLKPVVTVCAFKSLDATVLVVLDPRKLAKKE